MGIPAQIAVCLILQIERNVGKSSTIILIQKLLKLWHIMSEYSNMKELAMGTGEYTLVNIDK